MEVQPAVGELVVGMKLAEDGGRAARGGDRSSLGQLRVAGKQLDQFGNGYCRLVQLGDETIEGLV